MKNNTAFLMLLFNLRHYDTTKKPKQSGTSPWSAKSIWSYWSWNIGLDDGNVRRSSEINLREMSDPKKLLTKVPEHLQLFMFSEVKSVAAVNGTAENKESQSMQTQKLLTARKLVVKLNKTAGYHGKFFRLRNLLMMIFRKKKRSLKK